MTEQTAPTWHTPQTALATFNIKVTQAGLDVAREECLHRKGIAAALAAPPSASFAAGVVHQALANKQAAQASSDDDETGGSYGVRLFPFDKKIMAMLIVPDTFTVTDEQRDRSFVRSLIG